jgi:hypothetical protein
MFLYYDVFAFIYIFIYDFKTNVKLLEWYTTTPVIQIHIDMNKIYYLNIMCRIFYI